MSTTIDQQVVEMRFDNKHFEQNVSTTMSTLDKLKAKLGFDGATKGLEDVGRAAKNVDMSNLSNGAETVGLKFNAMYTMADQALRNITNSVMATSKRMVSALTIDPVKAGFSEYELKMDSIKTIMASTGEKVERVNELLNELNEYSDQTIYSFADMTQNIGKFTNAGVKLEDAVLAIKGISNEAAVSGANANEASRAMYNFAQALSAGYVKLIDWKSIENANMATVEFKQQLIDTAVELGVVTKAADGMYKTLEGNEFNATKNFNDVLQDQWMTTDVLIKTLGRYADKTTEIGAKAFAAAQDVTKFTQVWDILKETAQSGWARTWELIIGNIDQAKEILTPLTNTLSGIIDSFSDARNNLLEATLESSWDKLIKKLNVAGLSTEDFEKRSRDALEAAGYDVDKLLEKYGSFEKIFKTIPNGLQILQNALAGLTGGVDTIVNKLFDVSGIDRLLGWMTIGDDVKQVQDALEKLGFSLEKYGVDGIIGPETTKAIKDFQKMAEIGVDGIVGPETLAALERYNTVTKEVIDTNGDAVISYEELKAALTKKSGRELLIESFQNAGNGLLGVFKAIKEAWQWVFPPKSLEEKAASLYRVLGIINKFSEKLRLTYTETNEETGEVTKHLNDNGKKLMRTFRGIFAVVSMVTTILGGAFRIVFKVVTEILSYFNLNILDATAFIGDLLVEIKEWFDSLFDIRKILDVIAPVIKKVVEATKDWFNAFKGSSSMQKAIDYIKQLVQGIKDWWANLKNSENMPKTIAEGIVNAFSSIPKVISTIFGHLWDAVFQSFSGGTETPFSNIIEKLRKGLAFVGNIFLELGKILLEKLNGFLSAKGFKTISEDSIAGLVQGFKDGASKVWNAAVEMAKNLVDKVKDFLGIHSPSKVFFAIGGFIVAGLIAGLQNGIPDSLGAVKDLFQPMLDWIKGIDFGAILAGVMGVGAVSTTSKLAEGFANLTEPLAGLGDIFEESATFLRKMTRPIKQVVKGFASIEKAAAFNIRMEGVKTLAISLLALAAAVVIITFFPIGELWNAVGVIGALALILVGLAFAMDKINKSSVSIGKGGINVDGLKTGLIGIGIAVLLIAASVAVIGKLDQDQAIQGFIGLGGIVVALALVLAAFGLLLKGKQSQNADKFGKLMTKVAMALLMLVLVIKLCGLLKGDEMINALSVMGMFLGLIAVLGLISMYASKSVDKLGKMMTKMAVSLLLTVAVIKIAAGLTKDEILKGINFFIVFSGFIAIMSLISLMGGKAMDGLGKMLLGISISMLLMVGVMKLVSMLTPKEMEVGFAAIIMFAAIISLLILVVSTVGDKAPKLAATILAFSAAIAILALVSILCGYVKPDKLKQGLAAVTVLAVLMSLLIVATYGAKDCKGNIIAMSVAIALLVAAVAVLTLLDPAKLAMTTTFVSVLMGMLALLINQAGKAQKGTGVVIALAGVILILGGVMYLLAGLPVLNVLGSAAALSVLAVVMTVLLKQLAKIGNDAGKALKGVALLYAIAFPLMAFVDVLKAMQDVKNAERNVVALSILSYAMTGVIAILSKIGKSANKAIKGVVALTTLAIPLLAFVGVLALMQGVDNAIVNVAVLSIFMYAMTGVIALLSLINAKIGEAITGAIALALLAIPLLAFVGVLALMQGVDNAMANVQALVLLAGALSLMLLPLTLVGTFAAQALIGVLALTLMAVPLLAFIGVLAVMNCVENATTNAMALVSLITAIGDVLIKISLVAPLAVVAVAALTALAGLIVVFGVLAVAIGALMQEFPALQEFLDTGIPVLVQIAAGLGQMIGAFITAIASEVMTILPELGTCLSQFMANAMFFIMGAKMVDESVLAGVGILAGAILALTVADLINGVLSFLQGGSSFADLGTQLSTFMMNAMPFILMASTITPEMLEGVKALADTILIITAANVLEGLTSFITGGSSLETFAEQLPILGTGLANFAANMGEFTEDQLATVNCAAQAIKTLAQASAEIPNTGGLLGMIVGENDLGTFASQFPVLGSGLRNFLTNVGTFTEEEVATVNCAAEAIKSLASASQEIPNSGGLLGMIVGENDLGTFADQFPKLGTGLRGFLTSVGTFTDEEVKTVNCGAEAVKALASAAKDIPNSGGWVGAIVGENDLGTFADQFPKLGAGLRGLITEIGELTPEEQTTIQYAVAALATIASVASNIPDSGGWWGAIAGDNDLGDFAEKFPCIGTGLRGMIDNIGAFTYDEVTTINAAVLALKALTGLANADLDSISSRFENLASTLPALGSGISGFATAMPESSKIRDAAVGLNALISAIKNIGDVNTGTLATFVSNLGRCGEDAVKKFVQAFINDDIKTSLETAAKKLGDKVIDGIEDKQDSVKTAGENLAKQAVSGAGTQTDEMEGAGEDLGIGLVTGIKAKYTAAYNAGFTLGQQAVQGEKDGQASASPSKLTIQAGKWIGEGLVIGMGKMGKSVYKAGYTLGDTATSTISSSIAAIARLVDTDIDSQPTIRPVLDLSDVRTGVNALTGMLNLDSSVGIRGNVNAISNSMLTNRQNGVDEAVVSAINKLNKKMDNLGNTTYSINGITYDDGSNITDAVRTLVRAARIEGRV